MLSLLLYDNNVSLCNVVEMNIKAPVTMASAYSVLTYGQGSLYEFICVYMSLYEFCIVEVHEIYFHGKHSQFAKTNGKK